MGKKGDSKPKAKKATTNLVLTMPDTDLTSIKPKKATKKMVNLVVYEENISIFSRKSLPIQGSSISLQEVSKNQANQLSAATTISSTSRNADAESAIIVIDGENTVSSNDSGILDASPPCSPIKSVTWTVKHKSLVLSDDKVNCVYNLLDDTVVPANSVGEVAVVSMSSDASAEQINPDTMMDFDSSFDSAYRPHANAVCPFQAFDVSTTDPLTYDITAKEYTVSRSGEMLVTNHTADYTCSYYPLKMTQFCVDSGAHWVACQLETCFEATGDDKYCGNPAVGVCSVGCCDEVYCLAHVPHICHQCIKDAYIDNWQTITSSTFDQAGSDEYYAQRWEDEETAKNDEISEENE